MRRTRWSILKKQLTSFICESLKDRLNFIVSVYRKAHDETGKITITVDGEEVFTMCTITAENQHYRMSKQVRQEFKGSEEHIDEWEIAEERLYEQGIFGEYEFYRALEEYFNNKVAHSLNSKNILLNILALIDRRVGKRSLEKFSQVVQDKHEIVQYFFRLRCEAEHMDIKIVK